MIDEEGTIKDIHYGDRIFFDSVSGIAGTIYPVGTAGMPSNTIADVILMCAARNLKVIDVAGALAIGVAMQNYTFIGHRHEDITATFGLNNQNVNKSLIRKCVVSGQQGGGLLTLEDCLIYLMTDFQGIANHCNLYGSAMSLLDGGVADLSHCNAVHSDLTITVNAPARASFKECSGNCTFTGQNGGTLYVRGYKGTLVIDTMTVGTCSIYANGADITINATCTGGTINIYGNARVTDASAGATVNDYTKETQLDRILEAIWQIPSVIGVEWNQSIDEWYHIDEYGNHITPQADYFDRHPVLGGMRRCTLAAAGTVNHYGSNPRGDGLDLSGADGRVMVEVPKFYVKGESPSANVYRWWISPDSRPGYVIHPAFMQRGAAAPLDHIYVGAYDADFEYDGADAAYNAANEKLHSRTDKQPYTGNNDCIWSIPIDDLANEPNIGDEVSTPTDGGFFIVDYLKTAGAWGGGLAGDTATIWLRKPGDATCGMVGAEVLTNDTQTNNIGNTTAGPTGRPVKITDCRTLAENIGAGWGIFSIWPLSAVQLLFYTEYAGADSQTLVGPGVVFMPSGVGFHGLLSGFQDTDSDLGVNGTGVSAKKALCFDAGTAAFVGAETVTGAGGATATVDAVVVRSGAWGTNNAAGYLVVSGVTGTFNNNEALTGSIAGAATCDATAGGNGTSAPIAYRGIENLWGNIYQFIDGYDAIDAAYHLINRDGSGTFANPMAGGDYEASLASPITGLGAGDYIHGYIDNIEYEDLLRFAFIPNSITGSSSSYLYDYFYSHAKGQTNILLAGGYWTNHVEAGVGSRYSVRVATYAYRNFGARLEFTK